LRRNVARLLDSGAVDPAFDPGLGADGPIYALGLQANNRLIIGGSFTTVQNQPRSSLARLLSSGALDTDYHVGGGLDGDVHSITFQEDGKAYIGGIFTSYNG